MSRLAARNPNRLRLGAFAALVPWPVALGARAGIIGVEAPGRRLRLREAAFLGILWLGGHFIHRSGVVFCTLSRLFTSVPATRSKVLDLNPSARPAALLLRTALDVLTDAVFLLAESEWATVLFSYISRNRQRHKAGSVVICLKCQNANRFRSTSRGRHCPHHLVAVNSRLHAR